jgi:MSHA biogenesis protein MshO
VSFCVEGGELYRYEGYGFKENKSDSNPNIATHTIDTTKGVLLGKLIQNNLANLAFFNYHNASLTRNAVVNIRSEMGFNDSETVSFNHEIHLPNVP